MNNWELKPTCGPKQIFRWSPKPLGSFFLVTKHIRWNDLFHVSIWEKGPEKTFWKGEGPSKTSKVTGQTICLSSKLADLISSLPVGLVGIMARLRQNTSPPCGELLTKLPKPVWKLGLVAGKSQSDDQWLTRCCNEAETSPGDHDIK